MSRTQRRTVGLETTVMVDVLFILLIFFIVVSQIRTSQVSVELPRVESGTEPPVQDRPDQKSMVLSIDREGAVRLDGRLLKTPDEIRKELKQRARSSRETPRGQRVVLHADGAARSERLVEVLAFLSEAGLSSVQFEVDRKEGKP